MNGKGSKPRPYSVPKDTYDANWERAFRAKKRPVAKCYSDSAPAKQLVLKGGGHKGNARGNPGPL